MVIQLADLTGVYGLSFLMVRSSYAVTELYFVLSDGSHQWRNLANSFSLMAIALVATLVAIGECCWQYPISSPPDWRCRNDITTEAPPSEGAIGDEFSKSSSLISVDGPRLTVTSVKSPRWTTIEAGQLSHALIFR